MFDNDIGVCIPSVREGALAAPDADVVLEAFSVAFDEEALALSPADIAEVGLSVTIGKPGPVFSSFLGGIGACIDTETASTVRGPVLVEMT